MSIDMSQFHQVFFEESEEHLAAMESLLLELDIAQPDAEQLNAIFRAAHSIKGSSGTFGFTDLAEVTHILETLLDRLRKHETALRADMVDAFLEAGDVLKSMLAGHRGGPAADPQAVAAVCARLRQMTGVAAPEPSAAAPAAEAEEAGETAAVRAYDIEFVPTLHATDDPAILPRLLDELRTYGELEVVARPPEGSACAGFWHLRLRTERPQAEFGEAVDFVSESDAWRIRASVDTSFEDAGGAFGLFDAAPEGEDDSFGFFTDAPGSAPAAPADARAGAAEDEGYGFFDPVQVPDPVLPVAASGAFAVEGEGFGFFAALPEPAAAAALPVSAGEKGEEGEGFGFFAPLPAAAPEAAPEPVAPVVPADAPKRSARAAPAAAGESASIRVGVEKVDQLINLVGELVITQAMLLQCAERMQDAAPERLRQGLTQLERNTRDLQESVMSIRMLPISFVFSRFPRVVHDLSARLGKQVELKLHGETTELDKGLIERIADPLTHLIRNSLDHGIESPEARAAAGKNPVGTITLRAAHQGGNIVIEVGDDGAGLNRQRILAKARERGFQVNDQMSDQEVWALIFEAGFSTAEQVTDVSGRGVGMDVVRKNIQSMGGRVEIESLTGAGTRMTVRLPLTLAILDGMSVAVGSQTYILPLSSVIESLQPLAEDVKTLANQTRVIRVRGDYLPVIVLHEIFNIAPLAAGFTQGIMVILDADGTKAALFVDALVGQHQVVIKSLENNYRRVAGVSGATIMGDGHVALILDVPALIGMAKTAQLAA
ncbi:MAG: chemotaxis protein CheA [Candidatus Accumulibacter sp. 66-26]|nr:chemotaxis protein CheW [Accumulibacter sp.]OJW46541.1 MAG: chemotaxis protein CheA [Candidatus Accumulibacter sp. 66-26]